ncbi:MULTISPECIES: hypothetical protein [Nostocales]|uniref:Uncharacterized protein n=1 Tax=Tolypothrix bouteillei VB521301 TaxID=1479485 RepID=A0A0C1N5D7_9CYAN
MKNKNWVQLELDLPGFYLRDGTRVRLLPPHPDAGKTGRISLNPYWLGTGYRVNLQGKGVHAERSEMEVLSKPKKKWV